MKNVFFRWEVSDCTGWGVYGFNLLSWTLKNPAYRAIPLQWPPLFLYPVDFLMYRMLKEAETSWTRATPGHDDTVLSALGNWNPTLPGRAADERKRPHGSLGVMFFEANPLKKEQVDEILGIRSNSCGFIVESRRSSRHGYSKPARIPGCRY